MHARFSGLLVMILLGTLVSAHGTSRMHKVIRSTKKYILRDYYKGHDLFTKWTFFKGQDPTHGYVNYVDFQDAVAQNLAYAEQDGTAIIAVDSTSNVPPGGSRNSVRIVSKATYNSGLFVLDAAAMPTGCGIWPSFWTVGPSWPKNGEIDIVEGVNNQARNRMTLHTETNNCTLKKNSNGQFTGQVLNTQCDSTPTSDYGCSILDSAPNSFGPGFNSAGGGVFALLWDPDAGISMWHFARSDIPQNISIGTLDVSDWGDPAAFWDVDSCDISGSFRDHQMVIDVTICGDWAGRAYEESSCPGTCSDMVANATNFANAKWVINYLSVHQQL